MSIQSTVVPRQSEDRRSAFARDVIDGLTARPKRLSPKYFYDEAGSRLFEEITALPKTERGKLDRRALAERWKAQNGRPPS